MEHILQYGLLERFRASLIEDEKSEATLAKYLRDVRAFFRYAGVGTPVTKETAVQYKQHLAQHYALSSANSILAAVNRFFKQAGWLDCVVKAFRMQREAFRSTEKELSKAEYLRLLDAAQRRGDRRLCLIMETICSTGIRVSELRFITAESLERGWARVALKGKTRRVILPAALRRELKKYIRQKKIRTGSVFVTRNGRPLDRSNILHAMKKLCGEAGVESTKVFPHNLRHLFACSYYKMEKDLSRLADILGHANINTTRIYTRISREEQEKQIGRLGLIMDRIRKK